MNNRLNNIQISGIRKFLEKVNSVEGAISLTIGQPDFEVPKVVEEAMIRAIKDKKTTYTSNAGLIELRQEICAYLKSLDIEYTPNEICITAGGSEGLYSVLTAILNEGDKILIPNPAYPAYENISKILGADVINYSLTETFKVNIDDIKNKIVNNNIKCLILSFPCNPTGAILSKDERDELVTLIENEDILVITDDMYASIVFDEYYSVAQINKIKDKIIYVSGFSKMFSMTGLRIGYVACVDKYMKEIMKVHQYNVSCTSSISQYGALAGLQYGLEDVENMRKAFLRRKNYCVNKLKNLGIDVINPQGAFYICIPISKYGLTSNEFCEKLLYEYKLALVPGTAFGSLGEGFVRLSYCYSEDVLEEAFIRLSEFIKSIE